ncbi:MAPEG family protein [Pseudomonas sp. PDM16]|uniref:MAPEG family protein n=1 Tax=Pseudomonas sp. PDM16 TaxID=2769292 RepID=UPI0017866AAD|nr:MAPEG family protein [Pseudomonas sp. PDM16]MBD9415312.1 MAPEG family protein [Pseudomonas sp. PDM16]
MSNALSVYALCVVILFLKMFAISCYQGYFRLRFQAFTNAEDAAVFNRPESQQELPAVRRGAKAWANDLENIPVFFALGGLAVALDASAIATIWLSGIFTTARVLHSATYLARIQPWRTISYGIGVFSLLGLAGNIVMVVTAAWVP